MDIRVDVHLKSPELTEALGSLAAALREGASRQQTAPLEIADPQQPMQENASEGEVAKDQPATKEDKPAPDPTPTPAEQTVSLEQLRAKLAALSQAGKQDQVKSLISEFGGKKLSDIEPKQYSKLLAKAEELA